jgi:hypothetical protein
MKKIFTLVSITAAMLLNSSAFAGIVDVRFTNPSTSGSNFCVNVQVKAQDIPFELGSATVFFSYNTAAIRNPQHTPLNFNELNTCAGSGSVAPYKNSFNALESSTVGEGNYAILLMYPNQGCPTVQSEWIDVAQFCFDVVDATASKDLAFNGQYTAFNTVANNGDQLSIGTLSGLDGSVAVANPTTTSQEILITPNLTKGKVILSLQLEQQTDVVIRVFDMLGRTILTDNRTLQSGKHNTDLDLSKFSDGYYLVEVDNGNQKSAHKVLLAK